MTYSCIKMGLSEEIRNQMLTLQVESHRLDGSQGAMVRKGCKVTDCSGRWNLSEGWWLPGQAEPTVFQGTNQR